MFDFLLLMIILCYFFISLMYLLYTANNLYYKKKYTDMLNRKNSGKCISGCKQGICNRGIGCKDYFPYNEECCSFNFECKGCADIYDNHIYQENESEEVYQSPGKIMKLNSKIKERNEEIRLKNQLANEINESESPESESPESESP
jgi:hypothetical protein